MTNFAFRLRHYGLVRQTRSNRAFAFTYKHKTWLDSMPSIDGNWLRWIHLFSPIC